MHAVIYTMFIQTVIDLTETSVLGIFLAFMFLNFMVKVDPIFRKIFGLSRGSNAQKLSVDPLGPKIGMAKGVLKGTVGEYTQKVLPAYGNFLGKTIGTPLKGIANKAENIKDKLSETVDTKIGQSLTPEQIKQREKSKKRREKQKEELKNTLKDVGEGVFLVGNATWALAKGVTGLSLAIVEGNLGISIFKSAIDSGEKVTNRLEKLYKEGRIKRPTTANANKSFTLKGVKVRNNTTKQKLLNAMKGAGILFTVNNLNEKTNINSKSKSTRASKKYSGTKQLKSVSQSSNSKFEKLTSEQKRKVLTQIKMGQLKFSKNGKDLQDVIEEDGLELATAYAEILEEARETEKEVEQQYRELVGKLDEQISAMNKVNPEFARVLQEKKDVELAKTVKELSKPISEKDIYRAIQNYKSKEPMFNENAEIISQRDMQGIAKEINSVLEQKGKGIEMSTEFFEKVQREITENQRKMQAEKDAREKQKSNTKLGVNQEKGEFTAETDTTIKEKNILDNAVLTNENIETTRETISLKERVKQESGNTNAPNSGAPQQSTSQENEVERKSSVEDLVKNIRNASKGVDSKKTSNVPKSTIYFTKKLEKLEKLSEQAANITGEQLYNIDEVLERLKNL